jgi:hypothetical protein
MILWPFFITLSPAPKAEPVLLPCLEADAKCAKQKASESPVRARKFWRQQLSLPLEQRMGVAPPELLVYVNLDNIASGFPNRPREPVVPKDLFDDIRAAVNELPDVVKRLAEKKLAGIYFVQDLGGTGYTDYANGNWFRNDAGFIILDVEVLAKRTANEWATWKESSPFKAGSKFRLEALIENPPENNRKNAIQYILLHELGHIISIGEDFHPRWDKNPMSLEKYPFSAQSWAFDAAKTTFVARDDTKFPLRKKVVYYFDAQLDGESMRDVYEQWSHTSFPTLYAATSPGDDFAESFASYVHTVIQRRPWEIRILRDGILEKSYSTCWDATRCVEKRKVIEAFLRR